MSEHPKYNWCEGDIVLNDYTWCTKRPREATEHEWLLWFYQNCNTTEEWDGPLIELMKQFERETEMRVPKDYR